MNITIQQEKQKNPCELTLTIISPVFLAKTQKNTFKVYNNLGVTHAALVEFFLELKEFVTDQNE